MENEIKISLYSFQFKADFSNLGKFSHFLAHKNILMSELLLINEILVPLAMNIINV